MRRTSAEPQIGKILLVWNADAADVRGEFVRLEQVEIYADTTNAAVMRHPARQLPGVLVQGDSLYSMCQAADYICVQARSQLEEEAFGDLNELRNRLWSLHTHYKSVLAEHRLRVPFNEAPRTGYDATSFAGDMELGPVTTVDQEGRMDICLLSRSK